MDDQEINLKEICEFIYKRKYALIYILIIMLVLGIFYTFLIKKPIYQTNAEILIDKSDASIEQFVTSKDIKKDNNIEVSFNKSSKVISVITKTGIAENSFNITNNYINNLEEKLNETYGSKTFKLLETPQLSENPINKTYIKDISIFILVGIIGFFVYIFIVYSISETTDEYIIQKQIGKKVLGKVDKEETKNKKKEKTSNFNLIKTQLRTIYTNLELNKENINPKSILFIGTKNKIGNTYIVNNIAKEYAETNKKVLIIKSNKKVKQELDISNIEQSLKTTDNSNINILDIYEQSNIETSTLNDIINNFKDKFDKILIDVNHIANNYRTIQLLSIADSIVIVAECRKTSILEIEKLKQEIEYVDGKISGIILNKN